MRAENGSRHVFRVAAWYAVAAWLVIQIATNAFPHLLLPDWTVRLVIVLCLIGFPIALALAWALEVTPEGLKVVDEQRLKATLSMPGETMNGRSHSSPDCRRDCWRAEHFTTC